MTSCRSQTVLDSNPADKICLSGTSRFLPRLPQAFKGLKGLLMSALFTHLTPDGRSDLLAALQYPIIDPDRPPAPAPAAAPA